MKSMKRMLCALLACLLLAPAALAEPVEATPYLLASAGWTKTDEWYETDTTRALLLATMWCDVILTENRSYKKLMADAIDADCLYVTAEDGVLGAYFFAGKELLAAAYDPAAATLTVTVLPVAAKDAEAWMATAAAAYQPVPRDLFLDCLEFVMDSLPQ